MTSAIVRHAAVRRPPWPQSYCADVLSRAIVGKLIRLGTLVCGLAVLLVGAAPEGPERAKAAATSSQRVARAVADAQQGVAADTVDSLTAARRATVMTRRPLGPRGNRRTRQLAQRTVGP